MLREWKNRRFVVRYRPFDETKNTVTWEPRNAMTHQKGSVLITGGLGFIGLNLAKRIAQVENVLVYRGSVLSKPKRIFLLDNQGHNEENNLKDHFLKHGVDLHIKIGDISCEKFVNSVLCQKNEITSIFHLASAMSGQCEKDFDLGIQTNLLGTLNLLNATRHCTNAATFVFSSTGAVFGRGKLVSSGDRGKLFCPTDGTKFLPETTYGMTKSCCEALVNDYNRRGFLTGRSARLPTVIVRPGIPNAATTSIFSGIVREPLNGQVANVEIPMDLKHPVISHRTVIESLIKLHNTDEETFEHHGFGVDRAANLFATPVTLNDLYQHASEVAKENGIKKFGKVNVEINDELSSIVGSMLSDVECEIATALRLPGRNATAKDMVNAYAEDFLGIKLKDRGNENITQPEIGFIGLGNMGTPMVENLIKNNFKVHVYNRTSQKSHDLKAQYADDTDCITIYQEPNELVQNSKVSIICVCLSSEQVCEDVLLGDTPGSVMSGLMARNAVECNANNIVILDHSTCSLRLSQKCHKVFSQKFSNVAFLDAPVSGGPEGAQNGTLSIMCGGSSEAFDLALEPMKAMGSRVMLMGNNGAGTASKLVNQLLVGVHSLAASEALVLAKELGLKDLVVLNDLIRDSWGYSKIFERCLRIINDVDYDFNSSKLEKSGAPLRNLCKDLKIIHKAAQGSGIQLRVTDQVTNIYDHVQNDLGFEEGDMAIVSRLYKKD